MFSSCVFRTMSTGYPSFGGCFQSQSFSTCFPRLFPSVTGLVTKPQHKIFRGVLSARVICSSSGSQSGSNVYGTCLFTVCSQSSHHMVHCPVFVSILQQDTDDLLHFNRLTSFFNPLCTILITVTSFAKTRPSHGQTVLDFMEQDRQTNPVLKAIGCIVIPTIPTT